MAKAQEPTKPDPNVTAKSMIDEIARRSEGRPEPEPEPETPEKPEKDPAAVELGRRGGKRGGKARAKKLTPEQRSEIARKAARARWANKQDE